METWLSKPVKNSYPSFFNKIGKVIKANIITRGSRSLGYGFVALETEEDANKVVEELNKKELDGRQINVEVAKPKSENNAPTSNPSHSYHGGPGSRRGRGRFMRGRGGRGRRSRGRGRGRGGWQGRRRFSGRTGDDSDANADANDSTAVVPSDAPTANGTNDHDHHPKGRGRYYRRGRGGRGRGGRGGRIHSRRRGSNMNSIHTAGAAKTGEPSKTIVFVANLPFSINDDGLKDIFKDYNVASAHVVRRRGGRSKGFGFVTFVDEEEQKKALEGLKTVMSEGRELVIKVALSEHIQPGDDAEKTEAPAASSDEKKETAA